VDGAAAEMREKESMRRAHTQICTPRTRISHAHAHACTHTRARACTCAHAHAQHTHTHTHNTSTQTRARTRTRTRKIYVLNDEKSFGKLLVGSCDQGRLAAGTRPVDLGKSSAVDDVKQVSDGRAHIDVNTELCTAPLVVPLTVNFLLLDVGNFGMAARLAQ
jgi:hypothetical protein